ncbi:MAG: hypothetical protein R3304_08860 [Longimicrobiales bacterium]|nr:hypothetical protein [Longimicrobiales bacterium]
MRPSVECVGTVRVSLAPLKALPLFTPEGERAWVEGWSPTYPSGRPRKPDRGLVFEVGKESGASVWIVTRFDEARRGASYGYVLPRRRAALIDVDVEEEPGGEGSLVRVRYRMTSLSPDGDTFVRDFEEGFTDFLRSWETSLDRHLATAE